MIGKVIYVSVCRLTDKMAADWHIDFLIERGLSVEYWDIVSLVRAEYVEQGARNPPWLHIMRTLADVEARLRLTENRDAFYVMLLSFEGRASRVFRLLSKYNCRTVNFASGALPRDPAIKWRKIAAWLLDPLLLGREIGSRVKIAVLRRLRLVKPFAITFAAGDLAIAGSRHTARVVPVNFFDYDCFMETQATPVRRLVSGRYAVFLDINLPHHSDLGFVGYQPIDSGTYYRSVNRFFGALERDHDLRVVIAAHPKADCDGTRFEGRPIYRLLTAELVRHAEFVVSHTSTAMSFAVLNVKPLIFIFTEGMVAAYERSIVRQMRVFADCLDSPIYNIDGLKDTRAVAVTHVNAARFERYKYDFLTSRMSEGRSTQEIVWRELQVR